MANEKIIFSSGINGSAVYSLFKMEGKQPIITKKPMEEISKEIIRIYPEVAKKISDFYRMDFSGDLPCEIDMSRLDPSSRFNLIQTIALLHDVQKV